MSHGAASNTIIDINRRFGISEKDRVLSLSKLSFDLSVYDIFGMLSVGGTIVLPENGKESDPSHWFDLITKNHVTIWNTVPAMMQMLSDYIAVQKNMETYPMRLALLSGDWIPVKLPGIIERQFSNIKVVSLGGATEAGIWSNYYLCEEIAYNQGEHSSKRLIEQCIAFERLPERAV